jgi:hypothetical protein
MNFTLPSPAGSQLARFSHPFPSRHPRTQNLCSPYERPVAAAIRRGQFRPCGFLCLGV